MNDWVEQEFRNADLGDNRLNKRLKQIVSRFWETPSASLKSALRGWKEVVGAYRFFDNPQATVASIQESHHDMTVERVREHRRVVLIQDTTELDYTSKSELKGTGPLSSTDRQGFFAHTHLVVTPERLPLGVWKTDLWARDEKEHGKAAKRKSKPIEEKESYRWLQGYRDACQLSQLVPDTQVISCADREGDIYEIFEEWHQRRENGKYAAEWLIRCNQDRSTVIGTPGQQERIRQSVETGPLLGTVTLSVKKQVQYKKVKGGSRKKHVRSKRTATLEIRCAEVTLDPPYRRDRKLSRISFHVVMAKERKPPQGEDPIVWILLTSMEAKGYEKSLDIVLLYACRWEIEVFFRVLKTGCKVEELQLKEDERIKPAIALYMVVAWRVMYVMKLGRECPDLPCDMVFEEDEWKALWVIAHGYDALQKKPTLGAFLLTVAEFGGYLGRKSDGPPGPESIWRGLTRVKDFALAWQVFQRQSSNNAG